LAETAHIPEDWVDVVLSRTVSRYLKALSVLPKVRRLLNIGVKVEYSIIVPSDNREMMTGMEVLETLMRTPLKNFTEAFRSKAKAKVGDEAGIQVTNVYQPFLGVAPAPTTTTGLNTTTTMGYRVATARAPSQPALHAVVAFAALALSFGASRRGILA